MDTSTVSSMVAGVVDPVESAIPTIAVAAFGIFGLIFLIGFIPKIIKKVGK